MWRLLSPHLLGDLDDHAQLLPLLLLGEHVAVLGGGETALRRERELLEVDEFRRLVDAALDRVLAFELAGLRGDEAEHHGLALRHEAQRLEAARSEEHTSELQSRLHLVCRLLLEKKKKLT